MRYVKIVLVSFLLFFFNSIAIAGNWNKAKNSEPIPGELAAKSGSCGSSDLERRWWTMALISGRFYWVLSNGYPEPSNRTSRMSMFSSPATV